jgi:hypothetical protein
VCADTGLDLFEAKAKGTTALRAFLSPPSLKT